MNEIIIVVIVIIVIILQVNIFTLLNYFVIQKRITVQSELIGTLC